MTDGQPREPLGLKIYRAASRAAGPVAGLALNRRLAAGKEDAARIEERRGVAGRPRPDGALYWIHGASVGESLSVLPLVERLREAAPAARFLVTTGTIASAKMMAERLPEGAFHQYIPLDQPGYVRAFLDHWRPDGAVFVESEFWPNLILEAKTRVPFMALINGRVSPRSFQDWSSQPNAIRYILASFDLILAQDRQNADRLQSLAGRPVASPGNIKNAAAPLPADEAALETLAAAIGDRPRWLAASTHRDEEEIIIAAHKSLSKEFPNLLTIIAPRKPERRDDIAPIIENAGLAFALRSSGAAPTDDAPVYLADTLGELGLFYRVSDIAFVGGSATPKGGHNPLEPARLGTAILHGPHVFNFEETYKDLRQAGGAALVRNDRELATAVRRLLADAKTRGAMADAARRAAEASAEEALGVVSEALLELMNKIRP